MIQRSSATLDWRSWHQTLIAGPCLSSSLRTILIYKSERSCANVQSQCKQDKQHKVRVAVGDQSLFISLYVRASLSLSISRSISRLFVLSTWLYCKHDRSPESHTACRTTHKVNRQVDDKTRDHKVAYMAYQKSLLNTIRLYCTWQRQPAIGKFCLAFCSERIQASSLYRFRMLYNFSCKESPEFGNFRLRVSIIWSMNIVCIS